MKVSILLVMCVVFLVAGVSETFAQGSKLIILVRHGEKAEMEGEGNPDPGLSDAGKARAQRLIKTIGKYRPGAFYSTDYARTRDTITPLAQKRKKQVEIYDPRQPADLISKIMESDTKRVLIAGHSNTVPGLANLIAKKQLFRNLEESEYTVIWLIRIKDGKITKLELLDY